MGVLLNGKNFTLSIPVGKRNKALFLLNLATQQKKLQVKTIQQLAGLLNFLGKALVPGRPFIRRMYDVLKQKTKSGKVLRQHHHVYLDSGFRRDCEIWKFFLNETNEQKCKLSRPFVNFSEEVQATPLMFASDSSRNKRLGFGAVFENHWLVGTWGEQFILEQEPSIAYLELFALTAVILSWGHRLKDRRVIILCDNQSVVAMVNNLTSKCVQCMKLIRLITLNQVINNSRFFIQFIRSRENVLPDALSRLDFTRFWNHAPASMCAVLDQIPDTIWPIEKIWFS